jgi:hypothetical protein
MKRAAIVAIVLLASSSARSVAGQPEAAAPASAEPAIQARIEPETATIGDVVTVTLSVAGDASARIVAADWGERWGEAEIVSQDSPDEDSPAPAGNLVLRLRAFRTGAVELPQRELRVRWGEEDRTAKTPPGLALTLRSVLPPAEAGPPQPKPAQPPVALPIGQRFGWTLGGAAATIVALGLWLSRRGALVQLAGAAARLAPLPELLRALGAIDPARVQEATTATSAALRVYLRDALDIPAPESTTTEIRQAFNLHTLEARLARGVLDLLRQLDGVKFARRPATTEDTQHWIAAARSLAETIDTALAGRHAATENAANAAKEAAA